jgi:hypothetical protein
MMMVENPFTGKPDVETQSFFWSQKSCCRKKRCHSFASSTHPFILRHRFGQFLEIWFKKSGSRNLVQGKVVLQSQIFFWFEKSG